MASKPDSYNFTMRSIAKQFTDGKAAILSAMDELKNRGWVSYYRNTDSTGKYILNTTLKPAVTTQPDNQTEPEPNPDNQTALKSDNRDPENRMFRKSGRNNKTDLHNKKDIYKVDEGGDIFEKEEKRKPMEFTQQEIVQMIINGELKI